MSGRDAHLDYLVYEGQQLEAQRRIDAVVADPKERDAATARLVTDTASAQIDQVSTALDGVGAGFMSVVDGCKDLRSKISSHSLDPAEARAKLKELRDQHTGLDNSIKALRERFDAASAAKEDPAARRDALLDKYPALRR